MRMSSLRLTSSSRRRIALAAVPFVALGVGVAPVYAALGSSDPPASLSQVSPQHTCFGVPATIVGARNKRVVGTDGDDVIYADGGHVNGLAGDDLICGYADGAYGGPGADRIQTFYEAVEYHGGKGNDTLYGREKYDQSDYVYLFGDAGRDKLVGGTASESLHGGPGADVLRGGPSLDLLAGNDGNDRLDGGPGNDRMNGGKGRDHCVDGTLVACETGDAG
jgi:Ca2+-binding RTX toxin-like protein